MLLEVAGLNVEARLPSCDVAVLRDVSFTLEPGRILGLVGESGSGKSVMSLALMRLLSPSARIVNGSILFSPDGKESI